MSFAPKYKNSMSTNFKPVRIEKGQLLLGNEVLSEKEVAILQDEIRVLKNFRIWGVMQDTVRQKAIEQGFYNSANWEQTLSGKMMVYNLDILRTLLATIELYKFPHIPDRRAETRILRS